MSEASGPVGAAVTLRPEWLPGVRGPLLAWVHRPDVRSQRGVVVIPPVGYDYWTTHAALRDLAWALAEAGATVARLDLEGTGDSSGDSSEGLGPDVWRANVDAAVTLLRTRGCTHVTLVGMRLGASLALLQGADARVDAVVAIEPEPRGSRLVRRLTLLGHKVPGDDARDWARDLLVSAGVLFPPGILQEIRGLDLTALRARPAPRVLLVTHEGDVPVQALAAALGTLGTLTGQQVWDLSGILDVTTERAAAPDGFVDSVRDWVMDGGIPPAPQAATPGLAHRSVEAGAVCSLSWRGGRFTEQAVALGPRQLVGVLGTPAAGASDAVVVFLNSGAEHHVGPGRAWVEFARGLTAAGVSTLRVDLAGWGESVITAAPAARPYAAHAIEDVPAIGAAARAAGFSEVMAVGLCSSAYIALRGAADGGVDGVYALNPQLYWMPGDPDQSTIEEATEARRGTARLERLGSRYRVWSALDAVGLRPPGSRWLAALAARGIRTRLVFAEGDPGRTYLEDRMGRALSRHLGDPLLTLHTIAGIDHQMHREWLRGAVLADLRDWALPRAAPGTDLPARAGSDRARS